MKLSDVMLDVARLVCDVYQGAATAGTITSLTDSDCTYLTEYFTDGTVWILSGTNVGLCRRIKTYSSNKFTFNTLTGVVVAGVSYAAAPGQYFSYNVLLNACLMALSETRIMLTDETTVIVAAQEEYDLPAGVSDLRRVEVAKSLAAPYDYQVHHQWNETGGHLRFYSGIPDTAGYKIRLSYASQHPVIDVTGTVSAGISLDWLKWAAAVNAYRRIIEIIRKDNPTSLDMLNEAKQKEAESLLRCGQRIEKLLAYDVRYPSWLS